MEEAQADMVEAQVEVSEEFIRNSLDYTADLEAAVMEAHHRQEALLLLTAEALRMQHLNKAMDHLNRVTAHRLNKAMDLPHNNLMDLHHNNPTALHRAHICHQITK